MPRFTSSNAADYSARANALNKSSPLRQAIAVQHALLLDGINPNITPAARAQVARAWVELEREKRVMRGHGVPKPVPAVNDPSNTARKPRAPIAPITPA